MDELKKTFKELFGLTSDTRSFFSPGRINLIGEHTDYNGGHVFPAAITLGTYGIVKKRNDSFIHLYSKNFPKTGVLTYSLDHLYCLKQENWGDYVIGLLSFLKQQGYDLQTGFDLVIEGNLPNGAGLSSSASLELLIGEIARVLYTLPLTTLDLIRLGQKVENEYIGVQSGIMDQFAIGMGKKDEGLFLDTNTLTYTRVPVVLNDYIICIMNTNKRRELAHSKYNERKKECEKALKCFQQHLSITSLGELTIEQFTQYQQYLKEETLLKRARHAVYENIRTIQAKEALEKGQLKQFGQLLNESHRSLKEDYEVTGIELDCLVEAAQHFPQVLGARMTGAGFGGCAIALVKEKDYQSFTHFVGQYYQKNMGYKAAFYKAHIGDGTKQLLN